MIITLTPAEINISDEFSCTFGHEIWDKLVTGKAIRRKNRTYTLFLHRRQLQLVCPLLKGGDGQNIVLWPAIKLPFRKYPVYVYLYATVLYLSSGLSMRDTAAQVRRHFGLDTFSHSTVSRALRKLSDIAGILSSLLPDSEPGMEESCPLIVRSRWDSGRLGRYSLLLQMLCPVLDSRQMIPYSSLLNYRYFNHVQKFIV